MSPETREKNRLRAKAHYEKRKQDPEFMAKRNAKTKELTQSRKAEAVAEAGDVCADCGQTFPACCYDFHHLDPTVKERDPSAAFRRADWRDEITKCVMLCSNCHRIRHDGENDNVSNRGRRPSGIRSGLRQ